MPQFETKANNVSGKAEGRLTSSPEVIEAQKIKQKESWSTTDGVDDYFRQKLSRNFNIANGGKEFAKYVGKMSKEDLALAGSLDSVKNDFQEKNSQYMLILEQLKNGNYQPALKELERIADENMVWDNNKNQIVNVGDEDIEELRTLSVTLHRGIREKRDERSGVKSENKLPTMEDLEGFLLDEYKNASEYRDIVVADLKNGNTAHLANTIDFLINSVNEDIENLGDFEHKKRVERLAMEHGFGPEARSYLNSNLDQLRNFRELLLGKNKGEKESVIFKRDRREVRKK